MQAQEVAERRERSRTSPGTNQHPAAKNVYRLRSYLVHGGCGRRMHGRTFRGTAYYVCAPKPGYVPPGHDGAASAYLREDHLLDGLSEFLATRVFGSYRENLLDASLRELDAAARHDRQQQVTAARRAISDNEARSRRLLRNFELVEEPDQELIKDINTRRAELRAERAHLNDQLADLQEQSAQAAAARASAVGSPPDQLRAGPARDDRGAGPGDRPPGAGPQRAGETAGAAARAQVQAVAAGRADAAVAARHRRRRPRWPAAGRPRS